MKKKSMLYIGDLSDRANLVRVILERGTEFDFRVVDKGQDGLDLARQERPDLILLEVKQLPDLHGWEVLRELKTDESLEDIPVIAIRSSLHCRKGDIHHTVWDFLPDAYLPLPFAPQDLMDTVHRVMCKP